MKRSIKAASIWLCSSAVAVAGDPAAPSATQSINLEVGLGFESSTSPFLRLSDDGLFLFVDGNSRLSGAYLNAMCSSMGSRPLGSGMLAWSAHLESKRSPEAPDLNFSSAMGDLSWAMPIAEAMSVSGGLGVQRMWVADSHFRDALSMHVDWSLGQPDGGYWVVSSGVTQNRHPVDYTDLDGQVMSVSLHRRQPISGFGLDGIDLELGYDREENAQGNADLSQRRAYLRFGVESKVGKATGSLGVSVAKTRYDASLFPGEAPRRERMLACDLGVEWEVAPGETWALDATYAVNKANSEMFNNRYRNVMLTWSHAW